MFTIEKNQLLKEQQECFTEKSKLELTISDLKNDEDCEHVTKVNLFYQKKKNLLDLKQITKEILTNQTQLNEILPRYEEYHLKESDSIQRLIYLILERIL